MKHLDLLYRIFDAEYCNIVLEISFRSLFVSDASLFCVFRNLQKLIVFGQKSDFLTPHCASSILLLSGKTYLCFSRHASCNPINSLRTNRFMFLKAVSRQFDKSPESFYESGVVLHCTWVPRKKYLTGSGKKGFKSS